MTKPRGENIDYDKLRARYNTALNRIAQLEALLQEMHKSNHVLAARAVPLAARTNFSVACTCGHAPEEHGHDPKYPGSTACTVAGCDCIAYERGE